MSNSKQNPINTPDTTGVSSTPDEDRPNVDATTGDPMYDIGGGSGREDDRPERRDDPTKRDTPEKRPPGPAPAYDPIREPIEGDQDLGKRSETTPGRT